MPKPRGGPIGGGNKAGKRKPAQPIGNLNQGPVAKIKQGLPKFGAAFKGGPMDTGNYGIAFTQGATPGSDYSTPGNASGSEDNLGAGGGSGVNPLTGTGAWDFLIKSTKRTGREKSDQRNRGIL